MNTLGFQSRLRRGLIAASLAVVASIWSFPALADIEESGLEGDGTPVGGAGFIRQAITQDVLLVPESTNDRVMAFDPDSGNLINPNFIPSDPAHLETPIQAILAPDRLSILVSDQVLGVVQRYDLDGNHLGVFAPAGGADAAVMDNIRGITLRSGGNLLVTVASGANADSVVEFAPDGSFLGSFIASGAGGLSSPWGIVWYDAAGDYLVGGSDSDALHRYTSGGLPRLLQPFAGVDTRPEQMFETSAGTLLVANHDGNDEGVLEFDSDGNLLGTYDPAGLSEYRGVYELGNGNLLVTTGDGVHEITRGGALVESKVTGVSARFITLVRAAEVIPAVPPLGLLVLLLSLAGVGLLRLRRH